MFGVRCSATTQLTLKCQPIPTRARGGGIAANSQPSTINYQLPLRGYLPHCQIPRHEGNCNMAIATPKLVHNNPIYGSYFADPFVWKAGDTYYAIGTGEQEANGRTVGKIFPLLQSTDFVQWQFASNALVRPDADLGGHFWAPEVTEGDDGKFYL